MVTFEKPMLASENWSPESEYDLETATGDRESAPHRLRTGSKAIDELFDGGLDYGVVHCITSKADDGARDLSMGILAAHLLQTPSATATVIDSTLSFDVRKLHRVLQASVQSSSRGTSDAMEALNRLNISKIFDAVGLSEALAELRDTLQIREKGADGYHAAAQGSRATIEDSEDEEDLELAVIDPPKRLLIIDSVSHIMTPVIRNEFAKGQATLTSFMLSLYDITKHHNLCSIVLGEAGFKQVGEDETLSMFKSCRIKPAVGYGIGFLVDVHMYLHKPFKKADAQRVGEAEVQNQEKQLVSVLEVVEHRRGARYQNYAPFAFTPDGRFRDVL